MPTSLLNPDNIVKSRSSTPGAFANFMLGERSESSFDAISNAANNIVRFSAPNVNAQPSNISNLISTISTNILEKTNNIINNSIIKSSDDFDKKLNQLRVEFNQKLSFFSEDLIKMIEMKFSKINDSVGSVGVVEKNLEAKVSDISNKIESRLLTKIIEVQDIINSLQKDTYQSNSKLENIFNNQYKELENRFDEIKVFVENTNLDTTSTVQNEIKNLVTQINEIREISTIPVQSNPVETKTTITQIQNVVQNIQENVDKKLDSTIVNFTQDYQEKVRSLEESRPTNVLNKFLDLYKNAIGFINFFGNKKNMDPIEKNLKALQKLFEESFDVAKILRQTIIKIVNQLSNLPTASANSSGLNLDIDVPGGRLKQAGGPRVRNVARGAGIGAAAGIGMMGLGSAAELATSGMQRAREYQEELLSPGVQPAQVEQSVPEGFIDSLSSIVDRFTSAIDGLIKSAGSPQPSGGGGGGGGTTPPPPTTAGPSGPADFTGSESSEKAFNYFVSRGYTKEQSAAIVGNLLQENRTMDPNLSNKSKHKGIAQWDPKDRYPKLVAFSRSRGLDPNTLETQLQFVEHELQTGSGGLSKETLQRTKTLEEAALLVRKQYLRPGESEAMDVNRIRFGQDILKRYGGSVKSGKLGVDGKLGDKGSSEKLGIVPIPGATSSVTAAPTRMQSIQQKSQAISQPVRPQVSVTSLPLPPEVIDTTPPQQENASNVVTPPTPTSGDGAIDIPMFPTGNPDNFLTMYSRIVYNIVDG